MKLRLDSGLSDEEFSKLADIKNKSILEHHRQLDDILTSMNMKEFDFEQKN